MARRNNNVGKRSAAGHWMTMADNEEGAIFPARFNFFAFVFPQGMKFVFSIQSGHLQANTFS